MKAQFLTHKKKILMEVDHLQKKEHFDCAKFKFNTCVRNTLPWVSPVINKGHGLDKELRGNGFNS